MLPCDGQSNAEDKPLLIPAGNSVSSVLHWEMDGGLCNALLRGCAVPSGADFGLLPTALQSPDHPAVRQLLGTTPIQ